MNEQEMKKWGKKFKDFFMCGSDKLTEKQKEELWKYIRWQWEQDEKKKSLMEDVNENRI